MSFLSKELVFLILQFLDEENYKEAAHKLEKESGLYFNLKYFDDCVMNGEWDEVENYLSGFTKVEDNRYSMKIFFEIRKQKYLEALDKREHAKAVDILVKDLKQFSAFNEELFKEITLLLTLGNFRENEQLSRYGDAKSARATMLVELKKLIEANPLFREKLQLPTFKNSRLRTLINQSLHWQHQLCKNPMPNPEIKSLFVDHACGSPNGAHALSPTTSPLMGSIPKVGSFLLGAHGPFQPTPIPTPASLTAPFAGWMTSPSSLPHQTLSGPLVLAGSNNADSEHALKKSRPFGMSEEVSNAPTVMPMMNKTMYSLDDLPRNVVATLVQGSGVKSLDFHPTQHTLLLVGTNIGDITIWEVGSKEKLAVRNFKVWDLGACSTNLQTSLAREYSASVNRVIWSPDGTLFGVAYSKHIVHVYSYHGGSDLRNHLEIEAHAGNVSDLAFSHPNKELCIITCGEDKRIKVWDATTGNRLLVFEGHAASVYSVCPHRRENIPFIFSADVDGVIKAWLYDNMGSRVNYDAPGRSCSRMVYSSDGKRLFSSGTNKEGESYIVEWNESEGTVKRTYQGLGKQSLPVVGIVSLDTTRNRFLAVGDEFQIKFWDMDNANLLTTTYADCGLSAVPCLRFNKEGMLLAASTAENGIKILANADGARLLRSIESRLQDASKAASGPLSKGPTIGTLGASSSGTNAGVGDRSLPTIGIGGKTGGSLFPADVKPKAATESDKSNIWKLTELSEPSQLRSSRLPDKSPARIVRLIYTNSGSSVLALTNNALHKLWKWQKTEQNPSGKLVATASVLPVLCQQGPMTNDKSDSKEEDAVPCFALSKNDSYVLSASGGKISLFNMMTFKRMTTFMAPPPAATFIAFHPQDNNVIAIGTDDSSIQIFNIRADEVKSKLKGHQKRVTGLAFSKVLNVLASSGSDTQLCVWSMDGWERQANKFLQIPDGWPASPLAHTHIQFHRDQVHLLAVHESQIAIFKAPKLECLNQWVVPKETSRIAFAAYACDGQSIYASFGDGTIAVFAASPLQLKCRINGTAYIPSHSSSRVYPLVIAAHPTVPTQFAVGLTDGGVHVVEPLESEGNWGITPPAEKVAVSGVSTAAGSDQQPK